MDLSSSKIVGRAMGDQLRTELATGTHLRKDSTASLLHTHPSDDNGPSEHQRKSALRVEKVPADEQAEKKRQIVGMKRGTQPSRSGEM